MSFLLGFYSPYNQKNVTSKSRSFVYYKKKTHTIKHYIVQTRKV